MQSKEEFLGELEELKGKFAVEAPSWSGPPWVLWQETYGNISPKQFYENLKHKGGIDTTVDMKFFDDGTETVSIDLKKNGEDVSDRIHFSILKAPSGEPCIQIDDCFLEEKYQSKGIATEIHKGIAQLGMAIGASELSLNAGQVGGYAWAKYGFTPYTETEWQNLKGDINERINRELAPPTITFNETPYELTPEELQAIDTIFACQYDDIAIAFPQLTELNRVLDGGGLTVGKAMLLDNSWVGKLPLDENHPSYQRFQSYVNSGRSQDIGVAA